MAKYTITADGRTFIPDRDAYAVTVRVDRDGTDLGLWQTWISGIADVQIDGHVQPPITRLQRRRIAAELLADLVEDEARAGRLRDGWQLEVTLFEPTAAQAIIDHAVRSLRPASDFREGDLIRSFEV